jgi:hypothetical protein
VEERLDKGSDGVLALDEDIAPLCKLAIQAKKKATIIWNKEKSVVIEHTNIQHSEIT